MSETDVAAEAHEDAPVASTTLFGQDVLYPDRGAYLATVESLRDEGYCTATDLTVLTYGCSKDQPHPKGTILSR